MTEVIPFLRPRLPEPTSYVPLLQSMHESGMYSNFGPLNSRFERRVVDEIFDGVGTALTVSNATLGLIVAARTVGRPEGKYALMPSFTFAATAHAARWAGFEPWFVDVDPDTWAMDVDALRAAVTALGDHVGLVMPYATFGNPIETAPYQELWAEGVPVVIDAAASLGSGREGVQFCAGSVPTIFSMHATKAFAIGEGGLIYSHDDELVERMRRITNFGFDSSRSSVDVGINAKLSEILAAVALTTLDQFEAKSIERKQLYELYETGLKQMPDWQLQDLRGGTVAHQFLSVLTPTALGGSSVQARLLRLGVEARTYFNPACHQQRVFADCPRGDLGVSESVASRVLSLPLWEGMTEKTVGRVLEALK